MKKEYVQIVDFNIVVKDNKDKVLTLEQIGFESFNVLKNDKLILVFNNKDDIFNLIYPIYLFSDKYKIEFVFNKRLLFNYIEFTYKLKKVPNKIVKKALKLNKQKFKD